MDASVIVWIVVVIVVLLGLFLGAGVMLQRGGAKRHARNVERIREHEEQHADPDAPPSA